MRHIDNLTEKITNFLCDNTLRLTISFSRQSNAIIDDKNNYYDTQTQTYLDLSINFPTLLLIFSYSLLPLSTFSSVTRGKTWEILWKKEEKSWKIFLSHSFVFWVSVSSSLSFFPVTFQNKRKKLSLHLLSELFKNFFGLFLPLPETFTARTIFLVTFYSSMSCLRIFVDRISSFLHFFSHNPSPISKILRKLQHWLAGICVVQRPVGGTCRNVLVDVRMWYGTSARRAAARHVGLISTISNSQRLSPYGR